MRRGREREILAGRAHFEEEEEEEEEEVGKKNTGWPNVGREDFPTS